MVDYNGTAKRLVVGGKNGSIVIHELRASSKSLTVNAHTRPVTAVAMSDDGKHVATYSADEAKLHFYQVRVA